MTSCLQLADTDCAFTFEAGCRRAQAELQTLLRAKAAQSGQREGFSLGLLEIVTMLQAGREICRWQSSDSRPRSATRCRLMLSTTYLTTSARG